MRGASIAGIAFERRLKSVLGVIAVGYDLSERIIEVAVSPFA